jgi:hypothetical protein
MALITSSKKIAMLTSTPPSRWSACANAETTIGYFGVPGGTGGMTHLVKSRKALCGTRFHPEAEYQWCFPDWRSGNPECKRCMKIQEQMWIDIAANLAKENELLLTLSKVGL